MRKILTYVCAALLMAGLCGCEKPDMSKLEGTWSEQYYPSVFAMNGSVSSPSTGTIITSSTLMMRWVANRTITAAGMPST